MAAAATRRSERRRSGARLAPPRHPAHRARWLTRLLAPALALPLATAAALWLAAPALAPVAPAAIAPGPVALAVAGALALGLAVGRRAVGGGRAARLIRLAVVGAAAMLPALALLLAGGAEPGPSRPGPAALLAGLAVLIAAGLPRLGERLVDAGSAERRRWWHTSLRAARLTRRLLGAGVYRELCATGHIRVASQRFPGRVYLVPRRTSPSGARVLVEERGHVIGGLCLRPREPLPDPEEVVAHVLLLRGDERAYLAAANFFPYDTVLTPQATIRRL